MPGGEGVGVVGVGEWGGFGGGGFGGGFGVEVDGCGLVVSGALSGWLVWRSLAV